MPTPSITFMKRTQILLSASLFTLACSMSTMAQEKAKEMRMYRYTTADGSQATTSSITPEYARKGYQIVTVNGVVLSTVAPEPTAEEREKLAQAERDKLSAAEQRAHDKELLLRYNRVEDITIAKNRRLDEIKGQIAILNSNLNTLSAQMDAERQRAAVFERNGQPVSKVQLDKISDLQRAITVTNDQVMQRQQELINEGARFDADAKRLVELNKLRGK